MFPYPFILPDNKIQCNSLLHQVESYRLHLIELSKHFCKCTREQWWRKRWIPKKPRCQGNFASFVNRMRSWKEEEQITLAMKCHQFRICFDLLLYDCCLFPVAIHFFFWWNSNPFSAFWVSYLRYSLQNTSARNFPLPTTSSLSQTPKIKFPKLSRSIGCADMLACAFSSEITWAYYGGGWPLRFFCGNFHFSLKMMLGGELLRQRFSNFLQL